MIVNGHRCNDVLWEYTLDQFNLFAASAGQRKLSSECHDIAVLLHTSAAAFGSKESFIVVKKLLQERQQAAKVTGQQRTVETPKAAGSNLLDQLLRFIPVRRRRGRISR